MRARGHASPHLESVLGNETYGRRFDAKRRNTLWSRMSRVNVAMVSCVAIFSACTAPVCLALRDGQTKERTRWYPLFRPVRCRAQQRSPLTLFDVFHGDL